jgi:hypothetical protein
MTFKFTELQERWLQALESGEYKQSEGELHKDGAYCCLGVATHIFNPNHEALKNNGWRKYKDVILLSKTAPPDVVESLRLRDNHGSFSSPRTFESSGNAWEALVELNDSGGFTFEDIAKIIRENPYEVFTNGGEEDV